MVSRGEGKKNGAWSLWFGLAALATAGALFPGASRVLANDRPLFARGRKLN